MLLFFKKERLLVLTNISYTEDVSHRYFQDYDSKMHRDHWKNIGFNLKNYGLLLFEEIENTVSGGA